MKTRNKTGKIKALVIAVLSLLYVVYPFPPTNNPSFHTKLQRSVESATPPWARLPKREIPPPLRCGGMTG